MPIATQAQMADGQEEPVVKKLAKRLMIEDYFYLWIDDGEDNPLKGHLVNFVSDGEICQIERTWNPWLLIK